MSTTTISLGLLILAAPPLPAGSAATHAPPPPQETSEATAEDVEVMRRLLVRSMGEALGTTSAPPAAGAVWSYSARWEHDPRFLEDADRDDLLAFTRAAGRYTNSAAAAGRVEHSRGFHVPGSGVIYALDLVVPTRRVPTEAEGEQQEEKENGRSEDLWDATEREVRGQAPPQEDSEGAALRAYSRAVLLSEAWNQGRKFRTELDPVTLDAVVDAVLATLASHGSRMEGLGDDETITVAIHVTAGGTVNKTMLGFSSPEDDPGESVYSGWSTALAASGDSKLTTRIVVQLRRSDLVSFAEGAPNAAQAKERARINRY